MNVKPVLAFVFAIPVLAACTPTGPDPSAVRGVSVTMTDELRFSSGATTVTDGEMVRFVVHTGAADHVCIGDVAAQAEFGAEMADNTPGGEDGIALAPEERGDFTYEETT